MNPTEYIPPHHRPALQRGLLSRAAQHYEQAQLLLEAAACWEAMGQRAEALRLYQQSRQYAEIAPLLYEKGYYEDALSCYRQWLEAALKEDQLAQVATLLGIAACLHRLNAETEEAFSHYRNARKIAEQEAAADSFTRARCWEELGIYGIRVQRADLIHLGFEKALERLGDSYPKEQLRIAKSYRAAMAHDQLLCAYLEEKILSEELILPEEFWDHYAASIERAGFLENKHDVLHFAEEALQLEEWKKLGLIAGHEEQSAIDGYLRSLAPEGMIYIPAGPFLMGSPEDDPEADANEKPQHKLFLPGYYIGRNLVTNHEFSKFIQVGGYQQREVWTTKGWRLKGQNEWNKPAHWYDTALNKPRQPVVGISWYEAVAYCSWSRLRLITEIHWEKAASWDPVKKKKRKYPWGDSYRKDYYFQSGSSDMTVQVGIFPNDKSVYGMMDVAGNAWEKCFTQLKNRNNMNKYPLDQKFIAEQIENEESQYIFKGKGNTVVSKRSSRCASRGVDNKADRHKRIGFRLLFDPFTEKELNHVTNYKNHQG